MEGKQVFAVGQTVQVLWNEEGTNWKPGWYKGEIERFDEENDIVLYGIIKTMRCTVLMLLVLFWMK